MNYHQYYPVDIVNGPGTRCTLFVSGCVHECPGCYNKSTWRLNSGKPFTQEMEDQIIDDLNDTRVKRQGISLSGGDQIGIDETGAMCLGWQKGAGKGRLPRTVRPGNDDDLLVQGSSPIILETAVGCTCWCVWAGVWREAPLRHRGATLSRDNAAGVPAGA